MAAPPLDEVLASPTSALLAGMGVANRAVAGALARRGHTIFVELRPGFNSQLI